MVTFVVHGSWYNRLNLNEIRVSRVGPILPGEQCPQLSVDLMDSGKIKMIILTVNISYVAGIDGVTAGWDYYIRYECGLNGSDYVRVKKTEIKR